MIGASANVPLVAQPIAAVSVPPAEIALSHQVPLVARDHVLPGVPLSEVRSDADVPLVAQSHVPPSVSRKNSVAHLVARTQCATSGTDNLNAKKPKGYGKRSVKCATPKPIRGHEWRNLDSGWALFSRTASISQSGKRTSTRKYLRWYTQATIERIYGKAK